ncbi:MAG: hypothetical protein PHY16_12040 [Methylobacter sp.]|nr:hypothetical protein [Methylobacter sp.]
MATPLSQVGSLNARRRRHHCLADFYSSGYSTHRPVILCRGNADGRNKLRRPDPTRYPVVLLSSHSPGIVLMAKKQASHLSPSNAAET